MFGSKKEEMVVPENALEGRSEPVPTSDTHFVNGTSIHPPFPDGMEIAYFAMGCFWGAERIFWKIPGVYTTAAGYQGGYTPNPTYEEVCTTRTGHAEAVLVVYDPAQVSYERLLKDFWEQHDPTQGMRQGNDRGTQYRSAIYTTSDEQFDIAKRSRDRYQALLSERGFSSITTEIEPAGDFFYAEDYHQQYLAKNPGGYCNHGFCQVSYDQSG
ncbi:MAG: peptide-methionine (S)-S-oxide reductase MsrA [Acidimicrobiia bacterium]|nr:peptide-methionine (S)-S-oxide reductase MsrA [Acidimicrobiia bacterium]NNL69367.1 peptide-methionine (S)-S-oxide reductase MsrA [Acidimicrobiia bacterium]